MLFSSRSLIAALAAAGAMRVSAVVVPRQTPIPSPGDSALSGLVSLPLTGSVASTRLITTTWATTEIVTDSTVTEPDDVTPVPGNTTWVEWMVTIPTTSFGTTTTLQTCVQTATCTGGNWTKGENGTLVLPIPIPILVIINNVVPAQGKPNNNKNPKQSNDNQKSKDDPTSKENKTTKSKDEKTSTVSKSMPTTTKKSSTSSVSSVVSSGSSTMSSIASSSFCSSMTSSSSFSSSMTSSSSFSSSSTTSFSSSISSKITISSSSASSTISAGSSCPTGSALEINDDEGDNENPDAGTFCPHLSLQLNDEEDCELGDWNDFGNSSNIPIPTISFKPSSNPTSRPVAPSLPHHTTPKAPVAPTLPTSANRPDPTPTTTSTSKPAVPTEYTCIDIRAYEGLQGKKDCQSDEYCKSFEWWGPVGEDPLQRKPPSDDNSWNGWERTCEPYTMSLGWYYCRSCTRNPEVCKIIRDYDRNNWGASELTPIEECWADEFCESDRENTRICHERNPYPDLSMWQDSVFCMECPRNSPVERDSKGCMAQMDFKNNGRQDFPPYKGPKNFHDCPSHCVSDDYARRYCVGTQCWSCPFTFI